MPNFLQRFSIGLRKVNISGVPTSGTYVLAADQIYLDGNSLGGGVLESVDLGYSPIVNGPKTFANFAQAPILQGWRANGRIVLTDVNQNGSGPSAFTELLGLVTTSFTSELFAPVQINMFVQNGGSSWRGIYFSSGWNPKVMGSGEKRVTSNTYKVTLDWYTRDLLASQAPLNWGTTLW